MGRTNCSTIYITNSIYFCEKIMNHCNYRLKQISEYHNRKNKDFATNVFKITSEDSAVKTPVINYLYR